MQGNLKEFLVCLIGGLFGIHKFLEGNIKMGVIYLFTGGLFGIGWIIDLVRIVTGKSVKSSNKNTLLTKEVKDKINQGILPNISVENINLGKDEYCHFIDYAYSYKDKTFVSGYTGTNSGISYKISDGLTFRTGGGKSKAIRETKREIFNGFLALTNKRLIFVCKNDGFDKELDKVTTVLKTSEGISVQIGANYYSLILKTNDEFFKVFRLIKSNN